MLPILYSFRRCPYAIRARLALHVSATPYELREIQLRDKPAAMLAASPKGSVPVLVLPTAAPVPVTETPGFAMAAGYANTVLTGLTPAS